MFGNAAAIQADVEFRANTAQFTGDMSKIRGEAERTFGALDASTLKAALASEKYDRALARSKGSSFAVAKATAAYKAELAQLEQVENRAAAGSHRHTGALRQEERSLGQATRGAIVGSGALGHLGRAAIFASSSLLGGYGLVYALRSTITAAREQEVALGHLQVAVNDTGLSWTATKARLDAAVGSLVKATAFSDKDLTESLATTVRRFGDVDQALNATTIAADVARAKNIQLTEATNLVVRASLGQSKAAKALGVDVSATTTHLDALRATTAHATAEQIANAKALDKQASKTNYLDQIQQRYHGNAARFLTTSAGKQALFNAELDHTREIVGAALLPTLNHYLVDLSDWLDKMNKTGRLQRDVNKVVHDGARVLHDAGQVAKFVSSNLGGLKNTLELLLALKVASTVSGWTGSFRRAGAAAGGAQTKATMLSRSLTALTLAPYVITIEIAGLEAAARKIKQLQESYLNPQGAPTSSKVIDSLVPQYAGIYQRLRKHGDSPAVAYAALFKVLNERLRGANPDQIADIAAQAIHQYDVQGEGSGLAADTSGRHNVPAKAGKGTSSGAGSGTGRGGAAAPGGGLPYSLQNAYLEAQATPGTGDDLKALNAELGYLNRALARKGLTPAERNELLQERQGVLSERDQIVQAAAAKRKSAAADAARKRKQLFTGQTQIPAVLVKRLADAERSGRPLDTIVRIIRQEDAALIKQAADLRHEGAPASYLARIAKEREQLHREVQHQLTKARRARIAKLDAVPVDLKLAEANAIANNASEERLLAIYRKEKARLDEQLKTLKAIHATKEEILKNRQAAAAVQKKINAASKQQHGDFAALEREFLSAFAGLRGDASNVTVPARGQQGGPGIGTFEQHIHFPNEATADGHQEALYARRAAMAAFDG